jgi:hypothetical protein
MPASVDQQVLDDQAEREALGRVAHAMRHYRAGAEWEVARWERNYWQLSPHHRAMIPRMPGKVLREGHKLVHRLPAFPTVRASASDATSSPLQISEARQCIYRNHLFLSALLSMFEEGPEGGAPPHLATANAAADEVDERVGSRVAPQDHDRARHARADGAGMEAAHAQPCGKTPLPPFNARSTSPTAAPPPPAGMC